MNGLQYLLVPGGGGEILLHTLQVLHHGSTSSSGRVLVECKQGVVRPIPGFVPVLRVFKK